MKWSKLKSLTEERFAESVRRRVELWSTAYRKPDSTTGRGWITIDGEELVNFATPSSMLRFGAYFHESSDTECLKHRAISDAERSEGNIIEEGEFSRFDLHNACWSALNLSIEDARNSDNPLIRLLSVLDARTGRRKLAELKSAQEHPLVAALLDFRKQAEQISSSENPK